ncbi:MAG: hypothetical protein J5863_05130, partial [Desulfovibrio sp.]|nr:hypothetical protein [Desulfovibrio sp.]
EGFCPSGTLTACMSLTAPKRMPFSHPAQRDGAVTGMPVVRFGHAPAGQAPLPAFSSSMPDGFLRGRLPRRLAWPGNGQTGLRAGQQRNSATSA